MTNVPQNSFIASTWRGGVGCVLGVWRFFFYLWHCWVKWILVVWSWRFVVNLDAICRWWLTTKQPENLSPSRNYSGKLLEHVLEPDTDINWGRLSAIAQSPLWRLKWRDVKLQAAAAPSTHARFQEATRKFMACVPNASITILAIHTFSMWLNTSHSPPVKPLRTSQLQ